jgi:hypothetical protein
MLARTVQEKLHHSFTLLIDIFYFSYDVEIAYAKGLRKSSETFQKIAGRAKG